MTDATSITKEKKRSLLQIILTSGFLVSAVSALTVYLNSSFLETFLPKDKIGLVFAFSYLVTLIVMEFYAAIIEKLRNHRTTLLVFGLEIISLIFMGLHISPVLSLLAFVVFNVTYSVTVINYDIFLEALTSNEETGRMRGIFWSVVNFAWIFGPILSGILVAKSGFSSVFFLAAAIMVIPFLLIFFGYRNDRPRHFKEHAPLSKTLKRVWKNKNLRGIFLMAFSLYFFYAWMVIYTPLFLLDQGFSWEQIGQMFTIMLIPFVIIEYPAGWLADKYIGETEMLTIGFAIIGVSLIWFVNATGFIAVMLALLCTRIGASLVEIMRETYFYKQVDSEDLDLIDSFRNTRPLSYIIAPLLASALLGAGYHLTVVFWVLAILMLLSTLLPITVKDTK